MKFLCIGMMVCDTLLSPVPDNILDIDGACITTPTVSCGGDALNVALGLSKLDNRVSIIGRVSEDEKGQKILNVCRQHRINIDHVICDRNHQTAASYVLIDERGERHFLSENTIFDVIDSDDVALNQLENADIVYIGSAMAMQQMDQGGIADVFNRAKKLHKITAMDAAVSLKKKSVDWFHLLIPAFEKTDIFFPSLDEARIITGKENPEEIINYFRGFGMKIFGIKMGGRGCFVTDFIRQRYVPAVKNISVVDTTGAGDSFMAGLLCGVSHGMDVFASTEFASCVAARNIGVVGGTEGIPDFKNAFLYYESVKNQLSSDFERV